MKVNHFELVPHTADIRLHIVADTLSNLFKTALTGMNSILKKGQVKPNGATLLQEVALGAADSTALLIDFLSGILTLSHIHRAIFYDVQFQLLTTNQLVALISGTVVDKFSQDVKAVSYYDADITKNKVGNYETTIILDI